MKDGNHESELTDASIRSYEARAAQYTIAATILDRSGYSLEEIDALLAHTRKGVTAVYARWDKFDLRREMATVIERSLREMLSAEPQADRASA